VLEFISAWQNFMHHLKGKLEYSEAKLEAMDNRQQFVIDELQEISDKLTLLMSETNITADLHGEVLMMSNADPRNRPDLDDIHPDPSMQ
jgi:hypothetical protein